MLPALLLPSRSRPAHALQRILRSTRIQRRWYAAWLLAILSILSACSPALNWREVRGSEAPYTVLLPAKPASFARPVDLGGFTVEMAMTAAEVDDMNFAVASARITDPAQRQAALAAMQAAMLRNIGSTGHTEKAVTLKGGVPATEVVATGKARNQAQVALTLHARFAMHGDRVYQVIALGPVAQLSDETADTFLSSFVLH